MSENLRSKSYNRKLSYLESHPYYASVRNLYVSGIYKNILQCEAKLRRMRITKKGLVFKTSQGLANAIDKLNLYLFQKNEQHFSTSQIHLPATIKAVPVYSEEERKLQKEKMDKEVMHSLTRTRTNRAFCISISFFSANRFASQKI